MEQDSPNEASLQRQVMAFLVNRNGNYYIQYSVGTRNKRETLRTKSKQIAQELLRQFESTQYHGLPSPLPTKTTISEVVGAYARKMRATKTEKSAKADIQYLRACFGECCEEFVYSHCRNGARFGKKACHSFQAALEECPANPVFDPRSDWRADAGS
tara:strand:+ start:476037 stop:476507 length:471 start_codon:yes stop_codon:yes gene_type:complete